MSKIFHNLIVNSRSPFREFFINWCNSFIECFSINFMESNSIVLFVLFFLNIPIAFALMGSALFYFIFLNTTMSMDMVIQQFVTSVESFPYLAVPFFIMVGSVMNYSGISEELMNMAEVLAGHMKGGLCSSKLSIKCYDGRNFWFCQCRCCYGIKNSSS